MRIAFYGKGGSGKTTMSAAFTKYVSKTEEHVLAIDADINAHMQEALQMEGEPVNLGEKHSGVIEFLKDRETPVIPTTPPKDSEYFISVDKEDVFLQNFALQDEGISLVVTGSFNNEDHLGSGCFHGKLEPVSMLLNHLLDDEDDFVVADVTAGTDNLGTSMYFAYDLNVLVIEPTKKSIEFYNDFRSATENLDQELVVLGNKVEDDIDREFIQENVDDKIIGFIPRSKEIKRYEQGKTESFDNFIDNNSEILSKVREKLVSQEKDWDQYQSNLEIAHEAQCQTWYNDFHGEDLTKQTEDMVDYVKVTEK